MHKDREFLIWEILISLAGKIAMRSWSDIEAGAQTVGCPHMEIFKTSFDTSLSNLMQLNLP